MEQPDFFAQVRRMVDDLFLATGSRLDERLTGYSLAKAVHINIDRAMEAVVRTEHRISSQMAVDLRELVNVAPPVDAENLFITFTAESAQFLGGNATAFGLHYTQLNPSSESFESLDAGIFVPGATVTSAARLIVYLRTPSGDVSIARTGSVLGLDPSHRLISYQTFQFNAGLTITAHAPSTLAEADPQIMLYIFLVLTVFLMVNQGEAQTRKVSEREILIG